MLEEEVLCLRDLLSNFVLEESAILSDDKLKIESILEERKLLLQRKRTLRKKRLHEEKELSTENICFHEQLDALSMKIASQKKTNRMLKTRGIRPMPLPLEKKEAKKKKRPLILEDEPT